MQRDELWWWFSAGPQAAQCAGCSQMTPLGREIQAAPLTAEFSVSLAARGALWLRFGVFSRLCGQRGCTVSSTRGAPGSGCSCPTACCSSAFLTTLSLMGSCGSLAVLCHGLITETCVGDDLNRVYLQEMEIFLFFPWKSHSTRKCLCGSKCH